jgi:uncharacterized protein (DUF433 family)
MTTILESKKEQREQVVPSYIVIGEDGQARVAGTGYKVRIMAGWHRFRGDGPEEMQQGHPDLSMAQVYSVLAYYYDHKEELDADMDRREQEMERMRAEAGEPPFVARMKAEGLLPHKHPPMEDQLQVEEKAERQAQ